jgi:hypothetical protein
MQILENANFKNVTWYQKEYGRIKYNVKLPDESIMKDISDLNRFTDPYHPEFGVPIALSLGEVKMVY